MAKPKALNQRQFRFVEEYLANGGNATEAAKAAGFKGTPRALQVTGARTLKNRAVAKLIADRRKQLAKKGNTRIERIRDFWAQVMDNPRGKLADRLKASELLGKSEGVFVKQHQHDGKVEVVVRRGNDAAGALQPPETDEE